MGVGIGWEAEAGGAETPLLMWGWMGGWTEGPGTGAVMLMESCDPRDECEWAEVSEAEELCILGRRVCT